jgi:anaerobic selenocysteine-containing dehydrogenase
MKRLEMATHGLDLGALEPVLPARLCTKDRKIHLAPPELLADLPRLRERLPSWTATAADALLLIGRRALRSNNSWGHNVLRMVKGPVGCTLKVHPRDAEARGLRAGDMASITSRAGQVIAPVEVSDEVMPGVVSLPHGWGHDREGVRLRVASAHAGVSINDVTDESILDVLCGTASLTGVPVQVAAMPAAS